MSEDGSKYFREDIHYSHVLKERLIKGVEMDSAKAMAYYVSSHCSGNLNIVDFGGGPGHYFPVLASRYKSGKLKYISIDIDMTHVDFGRQYFFGRDDVGFNIGSVMQPSQWLTGNNCVVSANTLPHVPSIAPLLQAISDSSEIKYFVFRLLLGNECVQIKKHLLEANFDNIFEKDFQFNNIYSEAYFQKFLDKDWEIQIEPDIFDSHRLEQHQLPEQAINPFYGNRVSKPINGMTFKGDIYMPWKFVLGRRC